MDVRRSTGSLLRCLLGLAIFATACSSEGSTVDDEVGGATTDSSAATDASAASADGSDSDEPESVGSGASASVPPSPWELIAPVAPLEVPAVEPAADAQAQIEAMFSDVAEFIATDRRSADGGMLDVMEENDAIDDTPDLLLAIFGSLTGNGADTYGIIEAHATTALAADFDPAAAPYFEVRQQAAMVLREANTAVYDVVVRSRDLAFAGRSCLAAALVGDTTSCDEDPAAEALIDEFLIIADLELPDELNDFDDQLGRAADLCSLWVSVKAELGAEQIELVDRLVGGSLLDGRFLGRSECRRDEGLDERAEWDTAAGGALFAPVFDAVVTTAAAAEYDQEVYDLDDYLESLAIERTTIEEIASAAAPLAGASWMDASEPNARFGLLVVAYLGGFEAWFQSTVANGGFDAQDDPISAFFGMAPCGEAKDGRMDFSACSDAERRIVDALDTVDIGGFDRLAAPVSIIDWEDIAPRLDFCPAWIDSLGMADETDQVRVDFQMSSLELDGLLGIGDCDTGIDQGDTSDG